MLFLDSVAGYSYSLETVELAFLPASHTETDATLALLILQLPSSCWVFLGFPLTGMPGRPGGPAGPVGPCWPWPPGVPYRTENGN